MPAGPPARWATAARRLQAGGAWSRTSSVQYSNPWSTVNGSLVEILQRQGGGHREISICRLRLPTHISGSPLGAPPSREISHVPSRAPARRPSRPRPRATASGRPSRTTKRRRRRRPIRARSGTGSAVRAAFARPMRGVVFTMPLITSRARRFALREGLGERGPARHPVARLAPLRRHVRPPRDGDRRCRHARHRLRSPRLRALWATVGRLRLRHARRRPRRRDPADRCRGAALVGFSMGGGKSCATWPASAITP